jgi:hypothetical protein
MGLSLKQRFEPGTALIVELSEKTQSLAAFAGARGSCNVGQEQSLDHSLHL